MRRAALTLALLALGCGEPEPTVQPIQTRPRAEPPARSPEVLDPGLRVRQNAEQAAAERERLGVGGGGGGGSRSAVGGGGGGGGGGSTNPNAQPWEMPSIPPPPTAREVEAFQRELAAQRADEVDPDEDPCDQLRDGNRAGATAANAATRGEDLRTPQPSRSAQRAPCRAMREEMQQCFVQSYFQEHVEECQREMQRLSREGQRRADAARRQLDNIDRGLEPDPTEPSPREED